MCRMSRHRLYYVLTHVHLEWGPLSSAYLVLSGTDSGNHPPGVTFECEFTEYRRIIWQSALHADV